MASTTRSCSIIQSEEREGRKGRGKGKRRIRREGKREGRKVSSKSEKGVKESVRERKETQAGYPLTW